MKEKIDKASLNIKDIPIDMIDPNPWNPQEMNEKEFNALANSIKELGMIDPINVVPTGERFQIVAGEHRFCAARAVGYTTITAIIHDPKTWNDDVKKIFTVRSNVLSGKMSANKFMKLYDELSKKYPDEVLKDSLGFTDESAFNRLYKQVKESLPPEYRAELEKTKKELKTVEDLSLVLNTIFTKHGNTLPYDFMTFTFKNRLVYWAQMNKNTKKAFDTMHEYCKKEKKNINDVLLEAFNYWVEENV